jgi:NAD(P)-dependent dehydrogenase (short-subunit alcohol dehydrogenase family)
MKLEGKVAIVTGGGSGIGKASALLFANEGATVVISDRDEERGNNVVREIERRNNQAMFVDVDVSKSRDVVEMVDRVVSSFGRIDVLFNNAAIDAVGSVTATSERMYDEILDTNLKSVFLCSKYAAAHMMEAKRGVVINTASELGLVGAKGYVAYCASKGGVINLTRAMAIDLAPWNIRVNCLCPGPVDTPMLHEWARRQSDPDEAMHGQIGAVPLKRLGRPEEIATAALFLASEDSSFMTGAVLVVDGGATATYGLSST